MTAIRASQKLAPVFTMTPHFTMVQTHTAMPLYAPLNAPLTLDVGASLYAKLCPTAFITSMILLQEVSHGQLTPLLPLTRNVLTQELALQMKLLQVSDFVYKFIF